MSAELIYVRGIDRIPSVPSPKTFRPRFSDAQAMLGWFGKGFLRFLGLGGLTLASYFLISHCVLQSVEVVGVSMVPTLHNADRFFVNRLSYYMHAPQRGDV